MSFSLGWSVVSFEEGPVLRELGPTYLPQECPWLVGSYAGAWYRFLHLIGDDPNSENSKRRWRARGYRIAKVKVQVSLVDRLEESHSHEEHDGV